MPYPARITSFSDEVWAEALRHRGLVVSITRRYLDQGLDREDLIQEGLIGVCHAVESHDPRRGAFSNWAQLWIRSSVRSAVVRDGSLVRCTMRDYRVGGRMLRAGEPAEDRLVYRERFGPDQLRDLERIREIVEGFTERERSVFRLCVEEGLSLRRAGRDLGMSQEWVRLIRDRVLSKIRSLMRPRRRAELQQTTEAV
jgi:RNA polymerase sigma factor (sigma-70 family)